MEDEELIKQLKQQNDALLEELRGMKEEFKRAFDSEPAPKNEPDAFEQECAKLFK